jgi:hypothetical protein
MLQERRFPALTREMRGVDDLLRTTGAVVGGTERPPDLADIRGTHRQDTTRSYVGAAGGAGAERRAGTVAYGAMSADGARRVPLDALPGGAAAPAQSGPRAGDYGKASVQVYGNNRDVTEVRTRQGNFAGVIKALVAPLQDMMRTTRKEGAAETEPALGGAGSHVPHLTVYDANDVARTTIRQTMDEAGGPGAGSVRPGAVSKGALYYDPEVAAARTTTRQTTEEAGSEATRNMAGSVTQQRPQVYDPEEWAPATTMRQVATDVAAGRGGVIGVAKSPDPRGGYTLAEYDARTTMRQVGDEAGGTAYGAAAVGHGSGAYEVAPTDVRDTQRQVQSTIDYFGVAEGANALPTSQDEYRRGMVTCGDREDTLRGRAPTNNSVKLSAGVGQLGSATNVDRVQLLEADIVDSGARAMSPGRARALPTDLLAAEQRMLAAPSSPRADLTDRGALQPCNRLQDEVVASRAQLSENPYALRPAFS